MKQFVLGLAIGGICTFFCQHYFLTPAATNNLLANDLVETKHPAPENKNPVTFTATESLAANNLAVTAAPIVEKNIRELAASNLELENLRAQIQLHEQQREFEQLAQPGKSEALAESARKQFEQETIDDDWASRYQGQLNQFFRSADQLNDVVPQSIECRSSRCRITIAVSSQQQFNQVASKFINSITNGKHGDITAKALVSPDMEQGMLQLYVARDPQVNLIP